MTEAEYVKRYTARITHLTLMSADEATKCAQDTVESAKIAGTQLVEPEHDADDQVSDWDGA